MNTDNTSEKKVISISLTWLGLGFFSIIVLGILGGLLGQQLINPPLPPLNGSGEKLVTTIQEVTLSPSLAASQIVQENQRSVLAIAQVNSTLEPVMLATGLVVTSDGLVVTPSNLSNQNIIAIDHEGNQHEITLVGADAIFGLAYWRLTEGVFVPLEIRHTDAPVATELLVMSRSANTFLNKVNSFRINEYDLPQDNSPIGIQKLFKGNILNDKTLNGSPLVDDEGKIAGLLINNDLGIALPATTLRESLERITNQQHELNPVVKTGITPKYSFQTINEEEKLQFTITIMAIAPNSPAAISGIIPGDIITQIDEENLTWSTSFMRKISTTLPLKITVLRQGEYQTFTLDNSNE